MKPELTLARAHSSQSSYDEREGIEIKTIRQENSERKMESSRRREPL
jgi:hypothetical protein